MTKDDGSRLTPELLREYAEKDPRLMGWAGQAKMLLRWAADALEAAEQALRDNR